MIPVLVEFAGHRLFVGSVPNVRAAKPAGAAGIGDLRLEGGARGNEPLPGSLRKELFEEGIGVNMTDTASETGRESVVDHASTQLEGATANAQQKAAELKQQGRGKLSETLDQRTTQAGEQARQMAQALRRSGEQMREQGDGQQVAGVAEGAAERIERLGGYLEQTSGDDLLRDVEEFARRRPWMVAGIGLAVGVAASRFLKASSERRYESAHGRRYQSSYGYGTGSRALPERAGG